MLRFLKYRLIKISKYLLVSVYNSTQRLACLRNLLIYMTVISLSYGQLQAGNIQQVSTIETTS